MSAPVETKVRASTWTAAVCGLGLWALGRYAFKGTVPDVLASWTYALVPGILTFIAGYFTHHTHRPDLVPPPADTGLFPRHPPGVPAGAEAQAVTAEGDQP